MINFNDVLRQGGVDPAKVKMLRHTVKGYQILEVWRADRALAEAYQCRQKATFFDGVTQAACFLVSRAGETVFGGLYRVEGWVMAPSGDPRPLTSDPNDGQVAIHQLIPEPAFAQYEDRLALK